MYSRAPLSKFGPKIFISLVEVKIVPIYVGVPWGSLPENGEAPPPPLVSLEVNIYDFMSYIDIYSKTYYILNFHEFFLNGK